MLAVVGYLIGASDIRWGGYADVAKTIKFSVSRRRKFVTPRSATAPPAELRRRRPPLRAPAEALALATATAGAATTYA